MRGPKLTTTIDLDNPVEGDLYLDRGDNPMVDGDEATAQEIRTRLLTIKGEAYEDTREGVPWFEEILIKGPILERVRSIVRQTIQSVPAVVDVPRVELDLDRATRVLTISWEARTIAGIVVKSEDFPPLIITP